MLVLEGYPPEEMEEWLHNPITKAFKDSLRDLRQEIMARYKMNTDSESFLTNRGKELILIEILGRLEDTKKGG
jgi:hypothetical protein